MLRGEKILKGTRTFYPMAEEFSLIFFFRKIQAVRWYTVKKDIRNFIRPLASALLLLTKAPSMRNFTKAKLHP